jgi:hypothetical protein
MAKRKGSPTEDDYERIAEAINNTDSFDEIVDFETFDRKYQEYLIGTGLQKRQDIKDKVFQKVRNLKGKTKVYDGVLEEEITESKPKDTYKYDFIGFAGRKVVYARRSYITTKRGRRLIYKDKDGKFARVKK